MNALEMEEWRQVRGTKKFKVARPNDKLVVEARVIYKRKMKDGEVEKYRCRLIAKAGRKGNLFTHPSDSVNPDAFDDGGRGQGRRAAPL